MGDPKNTIREGELWVDDERKSVIERNDDGSTTFNREMADGTWKSYTSGGSSDSDQSDDADD